MRARQGTTLQLLACVFLAACNPVEGDAKGPPGEQALTERVQKVATKASKKIGEDCTEAGTSECLSGFCIHASPNPSSGYFCTLRCSSSTDCPTGWSGASVYPGTDNCFCLPPADWKPAVVEAQRPKSLSPTAKPPPSQLPGNGSQDKGTSR
jgi:hypothetical protein